MWFCLNGNVVQEFLDHILIWVCFSLVWSSKWAKPNYRERMAKYCFHVHPFGFFSPSSLFFFQLFYSLKTEIWHFQSGTYFCSSDFGKRGFLLTIDYQMAEANKIHFLNVSLLLILSLSLSLLTAGGAQSYINLLIQVKIIELSWKFQKWFNIFICTKCLTWQS